MTLYGRFCLRSTLRYSAKFFRAKCAICLADKIFYYRYTSSVADVVTTKIAYENIYATFFQHFYFKPRPCLYITYVTLLGKLLLTRSQTYTSFTRGSTHEAHVGLLNVNRYEARRARRVL